MSSTTKPCTKCKVETALTGFHVDARAADGCKSRCKACMNQASNAWHKANREEQLIKFKDRYTENADHYRARAAAWRKKNPDRAQAYLAQWRVENAEHVAAGSNARLAEWKKINKGAVNADTARRYASKTSATPSWSDKSSIRKVYEQAALQRSAGIDCHVDHTVPLRSTLVCGLHVPANLRIISRGDNQKKGNLTWPDQA